MICKATTKHNSKHNFKIQPWNGNLRPDENKNTVMVLVGDQIKKRLSDTR